MLQLLPGCSARLRFQAFCLPRVALFSYPCTPGHKGNPRQVWQRIWWAPWLRWCFWCSFKGRGAVPGACAPWERGGLGSLSSTGMIPSVRDAVRPTGYIPALPCCAAKTERGEVSLITLQNSSDFVTFLSQLGMNPDKAYSFSCCEHRKNRSLTTLQQFILSSLQLFSQMVSIVFNGLLH